MVDYDLAHRRAADSFERIFAEIRETNYTALTVEERRDVGNKLNAEAERIAPIDEAVHRENVRQQCIEIFGLDPTELNVPLRL